MLGEPSTFWGKLRQDVGTPLSWHPLIDHCADVAAVTEALLSLPVWRARLSTLAGRPLTDSDCARLSALAALHDIGKLNLGFQAKGRPALGPPAGHVAEGLSTLVRDDVFPWLGELDAWGGATGELLAAAIAHHGRPVSVTKSASGWQASHWTSRFGLDPRAGGAALHARCRRWFADAFAPGPAIPDSAAFAHAFAGLVMLADWLASDERIFPYSDDLAHDRMPFARARAQRAVREMGLAIDLRARQDPAGRDAFARVAQPTFTARPAQQAVLGLPVDATGSVSVLESETGSGKTEAALARFVVLFERGLVDGLYFALPTRSAATQIHRRVYAAIRTAFVAPPPVLLAVPGYLRVDDEDGKKLAGFEVLWPDADQNRYRTWAAESPKRYLAGSIVVGTIDQVLLSSLAVSHSHLRATSLLRQLLVVDEVHASDAYMGRILEDVLTRHRAAGGHALLLSATLGGEARARLLAGRNARAGVPLEDAEDTPYPLVTHHAERQQAVSVPQEGKAREVEVEPVPWIEAHAQQAELAVEAAGSGAKVLVIKNTVQDCIAVQLEAERIAARLDRNDLLFRCLDVATPHHARYARTDRERLDAALERTLGSERNAGGCVVIATQTVQQSLDLDADLLITDLCPADVLLQRIGRLHRHDRGERAPGFELPRVVVLVPEHRDLGLLLRASGTARHYHGLGSVYPDLRVLEATLRLVEREPRWRIPEMNRRLVERSVHSTVLAEIVRAGDSRWAAHAMQMMGSLRGQARQAELNLVDWTRPYHETIFPTDLDERISTRLGEGDRRLRLEPTITSPFGSRVGELVLRSSWVRGVAPELDRAERVESAGGVTRIDFGDKRFVYDRLGLRPESASKEVVDDDGP